MGGGPVNAFVGEMCCTAPSGPELLLLYMFCPSRVDTGGRLDIFGSEFGEILPFVLKLLLGGTGRFA